MGKDRIEKENCGRANSTPLSLSLRTVHFDEEGRGTRAAFAYRGLYTEGGEECRLLYTEEGEDGAAAEVTLSFKKVTPCVVKLEKNGAVTTAMHFEAGKAFSASYTVAGLGVLSCEGAVRTVENSLSERGGRLRLDYTLTVGGVYTRTVMTLEVAPDCAAAACGEGGAPCR